MGSQRSGVTFGNNPEAGMSAIQVRALNSLIGPIKFIVSNKSKIGLNSGMPTEYRYLPGHVYTHYDGRPYLYPHVRDHNASELLRRMS